ncbi:MAG TPA: transporter substrate-binding domain-containing protein [Oscillospiraceae bacterium]|jgi:ABC-type amino acid transport substrate-binding protein|nr:transporter substrate-binding domain-containing protein [Oscillospiraceae bacterium]
MKLTKKISAVVLAVLMIVVAVFAGCSSNGGNDKKADEPATSAAKVKVVDIELSSEEYAFGVDKKQPELKEKCNELLKEMKSSGELEEISNHFFGDGEPVAVTSAKQDNSKDQLVVATNAEFAPFEYKEGDKFYGIDMEIAKLLADKLGKELVIVDMAFDAVLLSVQQQKADIGMAGLTVTEERAKQVDFSDPYYNAAQKIICKADDKTFDNCKTKEDVDKILQGFDKSVLIGGQNGTTGQYYVEGSSDFGFKKLNATWKGYANGSLAVQDLINGGINYVIIDAAPATAITNAINAVA